MLGWYAHLRFMTRNKQIYVLNNEYCSLNGAMSLRFLELLTYQRQTGDLMGLGSAVHDCEGSKSLMDYRQKGKMLHQYRFSVRPWQYYALQGTRANSCLLSS